MTELDVVIVNHGTPDLCSACCDSLRKYMPPEIDYKILVVDNSLSGATYQGTENTLLVENRGYGNAVNIGVSHMEASAVLILNADTEMLPESNIEGMLDLLEEGNIAAVGPKQVSPYGWIASAGCPPANTRVGYTIRGWREFDHGQYGEVSLDCVYVPGSIVLVDRSIFTSLHGFLETPLYYEESFYCYAARHFGYRVIYTGMSKWLHHWDSSPKPDQHLESGRPIAMKSHGLFVEALQAIGYPEEGIPPFV